MYERAFVVFVDDDLSNDTKHVALTAAGELFDVTAEFDHEANDSSNLKWITLKSRSITNTEGAKAYLIACFHPQVKCVLITTMGCHDILQDAHGLWWRSLEHEFKVRMNILPEDENESKEVNDEEKVLANEEPGVKLTIQGDQESVAYASSYITELDNMIKAPPEGGEIDKANIRRDFTNELLNFKELKWEKYSSYNPYVLRTLLKWMYFVKGVTPTDEEYVLSLKVPDDSLIVLSSDEGEDIETEIKSSSNNKSEENTKIITPPSSFGEETSLFSSTTSSSSASASKKVLTTTTTTELYNEAKRKIDQNNTASSDDSVELLDPSTSAGAPMQVTTKKTSKRFALSTSPKAAANSSTADSKLKMVLDGLQEAINISTTNYSSSSTAGRSSIITGPSQFSTGLLLSSSSRTQSETTLDQHRMNSFNLLKSTSASRIIQQNNNNNTDSEENDDDIITDQQMRQALFKPMQDKSPIGIYLKNVNYNILRPIIIDGSNVAMQAGRNKRFSCRAILLAARYFIERGHRIYAFVPEYRFTQSINNPHKPIDDQWILGWMENRGLVVFTPSRQIVAEDGSKRRIACYDDNMIVNYAHMYGGIMFSKDNYRDVARDHPEWARSIEKRLLMFSWVGEQLMVPVDPHGKNGPSLEELLKYELGEIIPNEIKSKFMNEETCLKLLQEIDEALNSPPPPQEERNQRWSRFGNYNNRYSNPPQFRPTINRWRSRSNDDSPRGSRSTSRHRQQQQPATTSGGNEEIFEKLAEIFSSEIVRRVMDENPHVTDLTELGNLISDNVI